LYQTFYINAEGEVDVAYVKDRAFYPVEVKWVNQTRAKDLKQINKYPNGIIVSKNENLELVPPHHFLPKYLYDNLSS